MTRVPLVVWVLALAAVACGGLFVVDEGQRALVVQFGHIEGVYNPGLHAKLPLVQQLVWLDARIQSLDSAPLPCAAGGKERVLVDFYVKWRIDDPLAYHRATRADQIIAGQGVGMLVKANLGRECGARSLSGLVADGADAMAHAVRRSADDQARRMLGIRVVDVRVKRIGLPDASLDAVYQRMRAKHEQQAGVLQAEGVAQAQVIRADADRQVQVIKADGARDAARIRGEGDAQAAAIYAQSYGQDPEFFAFTRSLDAYRTVFRDGRGVIVLKPDDPFLHYFNNSAEPTSGKR